MTLKKGDTATLKATGQLVEIAFISKTLEIPFVLLLDENGSTFWENGEIKEFDLGELDYTSEQKESMLAAEYERELMANQERPHHHLS